MVNRFSPAGRCLVAMVGVFLLLGVLATPLHPALANNPGHPGESAASDTPPPEKDPAPAAPNANGQTQQAGQTQEEDRAPATAAAPAPATPVRDFFFFYSSTCPHCKDAQIFMNEVKVLYSDFRFYEYEINSDIMGREIFQKLCQDNNFICMGIPAFIIGSDHVEGFNIKGDSLEQLIGLLEKYRAHNRTKGEHVNAESALIKVPFLGEINPKTISLPYFTFIIGLLDGINPCAMWVLMFLLTLLVNTKSRRKMIMVGGIFVFTSALVYFLFMTAWFNFFLILGLRRYVTLGLGAVTIVIGLINIKDFFFFKKGVSMMIPEKAKPKLYSKARGIINAKNMVLAIGGTIALAFFVNIIELGCTLGLPAIYTKVLSMQEISTASKYFHMALYNIYYVIPLIIIVSGFVITMGKQQLEERHARILKLISGGLMLGLGLILVFYPELLVLG